LGIDAECAGWTPTLDYIHFSNVGKWMSNFLCPSAPCFPLSSLPLNLIYPVSMNKLRRERSDDNQFQRFQQFRPLRIIASGTLFLKHTIFVPCHPIPTSEIRAHSVEKVRGGSANMVTQFRLLDLSFDLMAMQFVTDSFLTCSISFC
jgi:hypothetical protein